MFCCLRGLARSRLGSSLFPPGMLLCLIFRALPLCPGNYSHVPSAFTQVRPENISDSGSGLSIQFAIFFTHCVRCWELASNGQTPSTPPTRLCHKEKYWFRQYSGALSAVHSWYTPDRGVVDLVAINRSPHRPGQHRAESDTPAQLLATSPVGGRRHKDELHQKDRENCPGAINLNPRQLLLCQTSTGRASKNGQAAGSAIECRPPRSSCPSAVGD